MKKQYKLPINKNYKIKKKKFFFDNVPLTFSQMTNFRVLQTKRVCRLQFQIQ